MSRTHIGKPPSSKSRQVIWIALSADVGITTMKFVAFAVSGSSAMYSEALHSLADTANQCLLLVGRALSLQPPDARHPFG
jgi:divalent metal cation (Fe/Co/Zn/Cd) transporter